MSSFCVKETGSMFSSRKKNRIIEIIEHVYKTSSLHSILQYTPDICLFVMFCYKISATSVVHNLAKKESESYYTHWYGKVVTDNRPDIRLYKFPSAGYTSRCLNIVRI